MNSSRIKRNAAALKRWSSETDLRAVLCPAKETLESGDSEAMNQQKFVLWTLVAEFGGEVVFSTLGRHLAQPTGWQALGKDRWLLGILAELEHCGALTLDAIDETEFIVRLSTHEAAFL